MVMKLPSFPFIVTVLVFLLHGMARIGWKGPFLNTANYFPKSVELEE